MIVDDVIAVRFLSKPYREIENLRIGSSLIVKWLQNIDVQFAKPKTSVIFTLPDKFHVLTKLNDDVLDALKPVRSLLRTELIKLDTHFARHITTYSIPLNSSESLGLYNLIGQQLSFNKFSRR